MTKNRGACALTRAGGSFYTIKLKSACREPDVSLSGLDPVPLSKIGTRLLASLGSKGKNRNSLACLRNAGSAESYCSPKSYCVSAFLQFNKHCLRGLIQSPHRDAKILGCFYSISPSPPCLYHRHPANTHPSVPDLPSPLHSASHRLLR